MKLWTWLKSLSWIVIAGAVFAAIMMVLRAFSAGKLEVKVAQDEKEIDRLNSGTADDIVAAEILQVKITTKKKQARDIRKKSEASLERIGQDETMADIAKRFNGKRVRSRTDSAARF